MCPDVAPEKTSRLIFIFQCFHDRLLCSPPAVSPASSLYGPVLCVLDPHIVLPRQALVSRTALPPRRPPRCDPRSTACLLIHPRCCSAKASWGVLDSGEDHRTGRSVTPGLSCCCPTPLARPQRRSTQQSSCDCKLGQAASARARRPRRRQAGRRQCLRSIPTWLCCPGTSSRWWS